LRKRIPGEFVDWIAPLNAVLETGSADRQKWSLKNYKK